MQLHCSKELTESEENNETGQVCCSTSHSLMSSLEPAVRSSYAAISVPARLAFVPFPCLLAHFKRQSREIDCRLDCF